MYKMYDKVAAVRQVQKYLENAESTKGYLSPSGDYDEVTREAVRSFQKNKGLPPTGITDILTFDAVYNDYLLRQETKKTDAIFGQKMKFPLIIGDFGEGVGRFNKMLSELLDYYGIIHALRQSDYYSEATEQAYLSARKLFGLECGDVDRRFVSRLIDEINLLRKK